MFLLLELDHVSVLLKVRKPCKAVSFIAKHQLVFESDLVLHGIDCSPKSLKIRSAFRNKKILYLFRKPSCHIAVSSDSAHSDDIFLLACKLKDFCSYHVPKPCAYLSCRNTDV